MILYAGRAQSHSNGRYTVRATCTVNHCSSCTSNVGVAHTRTHSGAGQCDVCKSSTVKDKAMVHNGITVYCCGVRNTNPTCFKHMLAIVKNLLRHLAEWVMFDEAVRHLWSTDFLETWIHAIAQSIPLVRTGNQIFVPSLHGALRTTCQRD